MRRFVGLGLAAACGAALADALDDALVYRAITSRAAEAAVASPRAAEALGGAPIRVAPWWRSSSVSAPLSSSSAASSSARGSRGTAGSVASASFTVTGPAESGSRSADVVVLAVAARERRPKGRRGGGGEEEEEEKESKSKDDDNEAPSSSQPPPPPPSLPSPLVLLRSLRRRWSQEGWTLVSADITLPRPGGAPGPAVGVSLMPEIEGGVVEEKKEKNEDENETKKE